MQKVTPCDVSMCVYIAIFSNTYHLHCGENIQNPLSILNYVIQSLSKFPTFELLKMD